MRSTKVETNMYEDQYIAVNDLTIRYQDSGGAGEVVLFTHGIGGSLEIWSEQISALAEHYRVIVWDLPGHGLSGFNQHYYHVAKFAQFAWAFLATLRIEKVNLAGNSMGAAISIHMLGQQSTRVNKIALLNSASLGREAPLPFRLMNLPLLGSLMARPNQMAVDQQIDAIFLDSAAVSAQLKAVIKRNVMRQGAQQAFLATLRNMTTCRGQTSGLVNESQKILAATKVPVLFIHGRQDAVIPCAHSQAAQPITPHARLEVFENCGHTPQVEAPHKTNRLLTEFFA